MHTSSIARASMPVHKAFTLIELLVVISIIALLIAILLPSLGVARAVGRKITCSTHERNLSTALLVYTEDNRGFFTPRSGANRWPQLLLNSYQTPVILICPDDSQALAQARNDDMDPAAPVDDRARSYITNGWNDYFNAKLPPADFSAYMAGTSPHIMESKNIPLPSHTILFGEKRDDSTHFYMDFIEGIGNDVTELNQTRHMVGTGSRTGGSNYGFADGSVRFLGFGQSLMPTNYWAVVASWRDNPTFEF